ncbi:MAG: hypothetical protein ABW185_18145 [Sedimenticola sp.]
MTDSGLPEVWIESSVFGENTAVNNMDAKSYNRTIRAHKLTYEALIRIVWPQFLEWLSKRESPVDPELKDNLESLAIMITGKEDVDDIADMYESVKLQMAESNIADLLHEFQSQRSPTVQYWQQYIDMIAILLAFIRAEREGNWLLHLSSFAAMLPWFAIYDRINYTRWGSVYLADMHQLELTHPEVYTEFRSGNFVVKQTRQKFNQLSTDQALEHVNKVSKMAGGLIGITREDSARDRWCLTFNQRSKVTSDTYEMLGVHNVDDRDEECSVWENKEAHTSRLARDEKDVQHIVQQFERFHVFTQQSACLVCLSTRDVVPEDITSALLNAERHGHEQVSSFVTSRLVEAPCTFHDTLKKNKSPTMATMYDVTVKGSAIEKSKSVKGGRNLFQRLLVAQKAGRVVSLEELMCHELSNTPISISDTSGNLRHCTNKADLCHILDTGVTDDTVPDTHLKTATVIDGHALVQAIGRPSDGTTFGDLADVFINVVNKSAGSRLDVVFDRYNADSIKSGTRTHRAGIRSRAIRRIIDSRDVPLPVNWKRYIDSPENKANLAVFLSNELMSSQLPQSREIVTAGGFSEIDAAKSSTGRDVNHLKADHEEADTRIILHAIDASQQGFERLNIVCKDTDVLVLLIHFADVLCKDVRMKVGSAKAPKYIAVHDIELSDEMRECLPAFHAVSGCDTVSQFSGHGKKSTWKVFEGKPGLLKGLGTGLLSEDVIANVEEFVCRIYSPSGEVKCVNELRCRLFQKGTVEPEKLPPTHDALVQHVKRAHFQTMVWMKASLPYQDMISPIEHGWTRDIDSKTLKPVLTTIDPLPKSCIETISCGCKSCATSRCGCRSKGMRCTPACACYDNVCHNPRNGEADSDNE